MNTKENSLSHIHLTEHDILGGRQWKGDLGLLNIIMLGLTNQLPPDTEEYILHRLLGALFSTSLATKEKKDIMKNDYNIPVDNQFMEDLDEMNTLSSAVLEKGYNIGHQDGRIEGEVIGEARGEARGAANYLTNLVRKKITKNKSLDLIAEECEADIETIRPIYDQLMKSHI